MAVPVITYPGRTFAGRHATSYLSTAGLSEFVAADLAGYVEMAVRWAARIDDLSKLRVALRERVSRSPVADAKRFADDFIRMLVNACEALRRDFASNLF